MKEMTLVPVGKRKGSVDSAMVPVHSMPRMRGKETVGDNPLRVKISEWLRPNPLIFIRPAFFHRGDGNLPDFQLLRTSCFIDDGCFHIHI